MQESDDNVPNEDTFLLSKLLLGIKRRNIHERILNQRNDVFLLFKSLEIKNLEYHNVF